MTENPVRCKYTRARALPRMLVSKRRRVSGEIYKSVALAGSHIFAERHHANRRYAENSSLPFSCRSARVTLTHFTPLTLISVKFTQFQTH